MADLTQPPDIDEALRRLIEQPSYAAQVLIVFARMLELDAAETATWTARRRAWEIATDAVLRELPEVVSCDSIQRAQGALPDLTGNITRGEAALRLRAAARALG
ncbi:hypothetical protein EF913_28355 [Streptomyces sp. WAC04189]|uniref:hypothetical protein n=1 Tax=Streptomyces sp. WAC04189 TaxID=2487411 RepID=UPI000FB948E7|nr:hypothetical protein [Streptomyces sp. WAC04189]RSR98045.1 hypothetical protein EF913_28355 [Streptomyces sp. WAC04189]